MIRRFMSVSGMETSGMLFRSPVARTHCAYISRNPTGVPISREAGVSIVVSSTYIATAPLCFAISTCIRRLAAQRQIVKSFSGLHPDGQGKLLLSFVPLKNYANVSAIEVIDETNRRADQWLRSVGARLGNKHRICRSAKQAILVPKMYASSQSDFQRPLQPTQKVRVVIAEDHQLVLEGIKKIIESECQIVGAAGNGRDLLALVDSLNPDLLLLDIALPLLNGIEAARQIHRTHPRVKIIFVTMQLNRDYVREALKAAHPPTF